jgi:hypothetical protein
VETASSVETAAPRAEPGRAGATLLVWLASVALLPFLVGFAAALRDGPGDLIALALAVAGALLLGTLTGAHRATARSTWLAALLATASLTAAYLAQRGSLPLDVALLAIPVAAAAAGTAAASRSGGAGVAILTLTPLPALIALVATGQLTPWAFFVILAVPDALTAAGAALRGEAAGAAAARSQLRVSAYLALALLLAEPRY